MNRRLIEIALLTGTSMAYVRGVLRGIRNYARPRMPWRLVVHSPVKDSAARLRSNRPAGIIGLLSNTDFAQPVLELGIPTISISNGSGDVACPRVGVDDVAVGELAARHLIERGYRTLGFVGNHTQAFSQQRGQGFRNALTASGRTCFWFEMPEGNWRQALEQWLLMLPKPAGILACNDLRALSLTDICYEIGIRIPEELAVLGVDDDDLMCELAHPSLSSIKIPSERIGYEAAALLEQIMAGHTPPQRPVLLPPIGVVTRQSTSLLAMPDADVASAVRFIREHIAEPIGIEDILRSVPISRRSLERKFQTLLGRTPLDEIRRTRIEHAKELLATTPMAVADIAKHAGFQGPERFAAVFKQFTGNTPTEFRRARQV